MELEIRVWIKHLVAVLVTASFRMSLAALMKVSAEDR